MRIRIKFVPTSMLILNLTDVDALKLYVRHQFWLDFYILMPCLQIFIEFFHHFHIIPSPPPPRHFKISVRLRTNFHYIHPTSVRPFPTSIRPRIDMSLPKFCTPCMHIAAKDPNHRCVPKQGKRMSNRGRIQVGSITICIGSASNRCSPCNDSNRTIKDCLEVRLKSMRVRSDFVLTSIEPLELPAGVRCFLCQRGRVAFGRRGYRSSDQGTSIRDRCKFGATYIYRLGRSWILLMPMFPVPCA